MLKEINRRGNIALETYANGPRKSLIIGGITFPTLIILWVKMTNLKNVVLSDVVIGLFVISLFCLFTLVALETKKRRQVPISVFIFMGFGYSVVRTLASITDNTHEQVINSYLVFIIIFGLYGFCAAVLGVWLHRSADANKDE